MIRGVTFNLQSLKSEDHAHEVNHFYQGKMGVTKGCAITTNVDGDLVVADGRFIIHGRQVANVGNTVVDVPAVASGTLYSSLVFTIDLTEENTIDTFNQGYFEIVSSASTYPTLIQQDLDNGGTKYQMEFCRFENTVAGIVNLIDTKTILDLSMYALNDYVESELALKADKAQEAFLTPTLLNGWVNLGGGYYAAGFMKDTLGFVHLRGVIKSGAMAATVFTLPLGYRPLSREYYSTRSTGGVGAVDINTDGAVQINAFSNVDVPISGSFYVGL